MTADPVRTLSLESLPELLASVPALLREVAELRAKIETLESLSLRCPGCNSMLFTTTKTTRDDEDGVVRRIKKCRGCGKKVTTREVIG